MDLNEVSVALAEAVRRVPSLASRTLDYEPVSLPTPPYAFVGLPIDGPGTRYSVEADSAGHEHAPGCTTAYLPIIVVLNHAAGQSAQRALRAYCSTEGDESLIEAIRFDETLGLDGVAARVLGVETVTFAKQAMAMWTVEIIASDDA